MTAAATPPATTSTATTAIRRQRPLTTQSRYHVQEKMNCLQKSRSPGALTPIEAEHRAKCGRDLVLLHARKREHRQLITTVAVVARASGERHHVIDGDVLLATDLVGHR